MRQKGFAPLIIILVITIIGVVGYYVSQNLSPVIHPTSSPLISNNNLELNLVGVWQDMPSMASGWSNRYHFFANGSYEYVTSQMDCGETRVRQKSGEWTIKNGKLKLNERMLIRWVDGKYIKATGSCGTKEELVDYIIKTEVVEDIGSELPSHQGGVKIVFTTDDLGGYSRLKFNLDGDDYWKFSDNPNEDAPAPIGSNAKADKYYSQ